MKFNEMVEDALIWSHNKNGVYTTKSGYSWLIQSADSTTDTSSNLTWAWIWKLKIPKKFKLLVWLVCHNVVPTLSLLHHRHIAPTATCSRCGESEETVLHCLRDCRFSSNIWYMLGFTDHGFFSEGCAHNWIKNNADGTNSSTFFAGLWWTWRH